MAPLSRFKQGCGGIFSGIAAATSAADDCFFCMFKAFEWLHGQPLCNYTDGMPCRH
jgi:hypothetical protein